MDKQRYSVCEKPYSKSNGNYMLVLLFFFMLVGGITSLIRLSDIMHSVIECICFVTAILICCYTFICLYYRGIRTYISECAEPFSSDYSASKYQKSSKHTTYLFYITVTVCVIDLVLTIFLGERRNEFSLLMLMAQFIYFLSVVIYKAYCIDLIVAFGENSFLSGLYVVNYDCIFEIRETNRKNSLQGIVIMFDALDQSGIVIGHDKLLLSDFCALCHRIGKV